MRIIRGKYGRRRFDVPKNITARPTTDFARENIFNVLDNIINFEGKKALDLFAGTGAISFEFASRGCSRVVAVEKALVQVSFIRSVKAILGDISLNLIRGDVFRFLQTCNEKFDIIFADPPYDLPRFDEVPQLIFSSGAVKEGSVVVIEHSAKRNFSSLPGFKEQRVYGSVNFSIFIMPAQSAVVETDL